MTKNILFRILLPAALSAALCQPVPAQRRYDVAHPRMVHVRTNLLYDALLVPSLGVEAGLSNRWSLAGNVNFNWMKRDASHHYWRIFSPDVELRYWPGSRRSYNFLRRGGHVGVYAALYRYDLEFGGDGQQASLNYGGGVSGGYSVPLGTHFSLDFSLGIGYMGGTFRKYRPAQEQGHYMLQSRNRRNYIGPTKAEAALVWHIDLQKPWARKGGY